MRKVRAFVHAKLLVILTLFFGYLTGLGSAVVAGIIRGQKLAVADFRAIWIIVGLAAIIGMGALLIAICGLNKETSGKK
ncbi:MAG: hypothetical protein NTZ80_02655 [Patescibacteria group bacterium]|nr:hypothetical protein [Patescibacteria group bacterium]